MLIIGIDPGINGAICLFKDGKIVDVSGAYEKFTGFLGKVSPLNPVQSTVAEKTIKSAKIVTSTSLAVSGTSTSAGLTTAFKAIGAGLLGGVLSAVGSVVPVAGTLIDALDGEFGGTVFGVTS